ncbi:hypothetical protein T190_11680 [Sinorhizobium meliloti CCBAU 01290]|nr:hypothetical protein T190_11680 [Sinorhizobium meliloti CCBAU 01290]
MATRLTNLAKTRAKTGSNETVQLAGCWAHLRRKFYDLHISGVSQAATDTVLAMTELWRIEDEVRGKDADSRAARRQEKSSTTVASLFELWEKERGKVSGKSKTAEAIRYALTRARGAGALSDRRSHRNRLQHRRTGDQAPNDYEKE